MRLEPFDETRADYRAAQIATMVFNMAVRVKDRKHIEEFVLPFGERDDPGPEHPNRATERKLKRAQTPEEQLAIMKIFTLMNSVPAEEMK